VVRGDADSTIGSRTTITLSSGKWAVVKPSSGAVTASLAKKRLVLFQLPSDVSVSNTSINALARQNTMQIDVASLDGAKVTMPVAGGDSGLLDAGKHGNFTISAPLSDESANMRLAVTPDKRSDFPSGARLLAPTFSSHMVLSSARHEECTTNLASRVPAVPVATAIGSLDPVAVPQLGRLPSIAQASHMKGYFTPAGSSGDSVQPAAAASAAQGASVVAASQPAQSVNAKKDKKDKKGKKDKKKKRQSNGGGE